MNNAEIRVTLSLTLKVFQRHFTKLYSWKGIPGTRRSSRKRWLGVSLVRQVSTSKQTGDDDVLVHQPSTEVSQQGTVAQYH